MIPVWQTCPCCNDRFLGSDVIGFPCSRCIELDGALNPLEWTQALNQVTYQEEIKDDV
jgi:hypothetical protein